MQLYYKNITSLLIYICGFGMLASFAACVPTQAINDATKVTIKKKKKAVWLYAGVIWQA